MNMYAQELLLKPVENEVKPSDDKSYLSPYKHLDQALEHIFVSGKDSAKIQTLKRLLDNPELTDADLKSILGDFMFLTDTWLDMFERRIFEGNTLQDLLKGDLK